MNQLSDGKNGEKPRILVAPLDWGLGHATRCIPLIRELLRQGADPILAGEGAQEELLRTEFPGLPFLSLPGYRVLYSKTKRGLAWKMLQQGPRIRKAIRYEHEWLKKMIAEQRIDAVISDNRYGLHHAGIPCFFITHQLAIQSPFGKWTEKELQRRNYNYINRFTECWIPDHEGPDNLAADLSHPVKKPAIPVRYTGFLSRFEKKQITIVKNKILIIISGPEPQRRLFEEKILAGISSYDGRATIVRGLPGHATMIPSTNMIKIFNHLPSSSLNDEMMEAEYIISRSGYSTVMDIAALQKKSILVPTPGQTEQEYLGNNLMKKGMALCIAQDEFSLPGALEKGRNYSYDHCFPAKDEALERTIARLMNQL